MREAGHRRVPHPGGTQAYLGEAVRPGATLTRSIWPVWNPWTTRTTSVPPSLRTRGEEGRL